MTNNDLEKRGLAILGSTGSIGTQALDVVRAHNDRFSVEVLVARSNADLLITQALEFLPNTVVITNEDKYEQVQDALAGKDIKVFTSEDAAVQVVGMDEVDMVLAAIVGYAGLRSTLAAIDAGKQIALANKESLVVAGELVTQNAQAAGVNIYPVDSEHSAIFQCLTGEHHNPIEKIYLTASGGPFRGMGREQLATVTKEQALKHPNWDMGAKITIDSASLMNKGLEVIEAKWLFGLEASQVEVVVHPQSVIHSIVQFTDGSMKAQMGLPDMKLPIQYALGYPERLSSDFPRFNFMDYPELNFEKPDTESFRNLALAFEAIEKGGNCPCVLNAANEVAVQAFLDSSIGFLDMTEVIGQTMEKVEFVDNPTYEDYVESDSLARVRAKELVTEGKLKV